LRTLAGEAEVHPLALPEAALRARSREAKLRSEVLTVLAGETYARELLMLEPLLDEYDGIEVAAAVLRLLERERSTPLEGRAAAAASAGTARIFVNLGTRDNVAAGDLMGAMVNETGATRESIGRIELRDTFSLVDVPAAQAEAIAAKLTGITVRGRRILARVEQERPRPTATSRPARAPSAAGERSERPPRSNDRGAPRGHDRGAPRGERPSYSDRARSDRPRSDRPSHDRVRSDRPSHDRPRSDRPRSDRPSHDRPRSDRPRSDRPRSENRGAGERARPPRRDRE
jgi:hypothetical protein